MKLSIFTTATNPTSRKDLDKEALNCYSQLADELIYVDGSGDLPNETLLKHKQDMYSNYIDLKELHYKWEKEFDWSFIGQQFQRGYEACTGDIVIHADLDFIFHENHYESIRKVAERLLEEHEPACSFYKYQLDTILNQD